MHIEAMWSDRPEILHQWRWIDFQFVSDAVDITHWQIDLQEWYRTSFVVECVGDRPSGNGTRTVLDAGSQRVRASSRATATFRVSKD